MTSQLNPSTYLLEVTIPLLCLCNDMFRLFHPPLMESIRREKSPSHQSLKDDEIIEAITFPWLTFSVFHSPKHCALSLSLSHTPCWLGFMNLMILLLYSTNLLTVRTNVYKKFRCQHLLRYDAHSLYHYKQSGTLYRATTRETGLHSFASLSSAWLWLGVIVKAYSIL